MSTACGPVEVAVLGEGPAVLVFHGAPGGVDQGALLAPLADEGFRVIAFSRPGYLGTPLASGPTVAGQGDLAAALLDALDVARAAAVGLSAGGPAALALATRHPHRTRALVLEAAVTDAYVPADLARSRLPGRLLLSPWLGGPSFWALHLLMRWWPRAAASQLLEIESTLDPARRRACAEAIAAEPGPWRALADSLVPFSARRAGLVNDLARLAALDVQAWAGLAVPTLIQHSPSDADVPLHHARALLALGVPARLALHEAACGHLLWFGAAGEAVARERLAFLRETLAGEGGVG